MRALPSPDAMYAAILSRDPSFEGVFLFGVSTTGVFCRPTCAARKPRRENVEFFRDAGEAIRAGYRACRRCAPLDAPGAPPPWAARLLERVRRAPSERIPDSALAEFGVGARAARRWFLARHGMTFQAFQRAHRLGHALAALREGGGVLQVGLSHGYDSASGFSSALSRATGRPPGRSREARPLAARRLVTPLGRMLAVASTRGLRVLEFSDDRAREREGGTRRRERVVPVLPGPSEVLDRAEDEVRRWFAGTLIEFTVPLDACGTPFQRLVWDRLARIPYGATASYAEVARDVGTPTAVRAVGRANGANPLAVVVPCHRVVRSDGALGGYGGGVWRKRWLLDHERAVLADRGARVDDARATPREAGAPPRR